MQEIRELFTRAQNEGFAIGAFNVANIETFKAIIEAAKEKQSPVLLESSDGETAFMGAANLVALVENARAETGLPIYTNLDHSRKVESVIEAIESGYDLVHYDGSKEVLETNVENLKKIIEFAHEKNILVEGEMDYIIEGSEVRTLSADEGLAQSQLTKPLAAAEFVQQSALDTFAVSIGNVHGLYTTPKIIDLGLLAEIRRQLKCFLSLHGGSGISDDQIRGAIEIGRVVKINVSTEIRRAFHDTLDQSIHAHPEEVAMYKISTDAITEMKNIVAAKMDLFGSSGKAS